MTKQSKQNSIPYPFLESWMHTRIPLPPRTPLGHNVEKNIKHPEMDVVDSILSRLVKRLHLLHPILGWIYYRLIMRSMYWYLRLVHRMEIHGKENIPPEGGIFCINHPHNMDVVMTFMAAFNHPVGVFTDIGTGFLVDLTERIGFVPRRGTGAQMTEKMIRHIALKNRYFAMWPEGTPDKGHGIMQGFSSIIKVYATLNVGKNRIPLVPVVMQVISAKVKQNPKRRKKASKQGKKRRRKKYKPPHVSKRLIFTYLPPVYFPQSWLQNPEQGGKTPRFMIDWLMGRIAHSLGQKELAQNPVLNRRRTQHQAWHQ